MKKIINICTCCLLIFYGARCSSNTNKQSGNISASQYLDIYVVENLNAFINIEIKEIKNFDLPQNINLKDTVFEAEDGTTWKGIVFFAASNQELLFAESNWENEEVVKRVTVVNNSISSKNNLRVGSSFGEIKDYLSNIIPSYPDGYFGLKDKSNVNITYFFDIDFNNNVIFNDFEDIPDTLEVKQILIE